MKPSSLFLFFILGLIFSACTQRKQIPTQIELNENWTFRAMDDSLSFRAEVPGCIHTDLMANDLIPDPFFRMNEKEVQWVDKKDWEYRTTFVAPEDIINRKHKELIFYGLDTWANVYLNDSLILKANNMYRIWKCPVGRLLREGQNELRIVFLSPVKKGLQLLNEQPYLFPVSANDQSELGGLGDRRVSIFLRKAPYHFGWDWGPRLVTSGIWKPIVLKAWDDAIIRDVYIRQDELSDSLAKLTVQCRAQLNDAIEANVHILVDGKLYSSQDVKLEKGDQVFSIPIEITNPKRWWPNGLGEQPLYAIEVQLLNGRRMLDSRITQIGLREIKLIQKPDSIGESFYFEVNGYPVFMKGANMIPLDVFLPRIQPEDYQKIIQSAKDSHMNMLRVWGGGIYESEIFYDLCDKNGILVWQDFMFACSMVPGDSAYIENVKQEAIDNITRLRNHPSLALWCGNNEVLSAWNNWGWKDDVVKEQGPEIADKIWNNYEMLFHHVLPDLVHAFDPGRPYHPSSPGGKAGITENANSGDMHYWMVWWGKKPFGDYQKVIPRFMSEYGFQSFPELKTVNKFADTNDWGIYSDVMKAHQRSSIGNKTIEEYLVRDYRQPVDFPKFLYVNQLLQARGIGMAIEAHRSHMPRCMGSLYWQLNDVWPVASWSGMDYYGSWKALQYKVKKSFREVILVPEVQSDSLCISVVSDRLDTIYSSLSLKLLDFNGRVITEMMRPVVILPNTSRQVFHSSMGDFLQDNDSSGIVLQGQLLDIDSNCITDKLFYFAKPKNLDLEKPNVVFQFIQDSANQIHIHVTTDFLTKNIYLQSGLDGYFSDNFFDVLPGTDYSLVFYSEEKIEVEQFEKGFQSMSLWDSFAVH